MSAAAGAIISLIILLVFFTFVLYLLLHGEHRQLLAVKLAASTIFGHVPLALFHQPAVIYFMLLEHPIDHEPHVEGGFCCWMMELVGPFTVMVVPLTLMMFTIERLMYIRDPTGHAQKITRTGAVTLIVFPWVISSVLTLINVVVIRSNYQNAATFDVCSFQTNKHLYDVMYIMMRQVIGGVIPMLINIIVTISVLIMWCCFKRKMSRGVDYSVMGEEIEATVRNSVIAVAVLNALFVPVFIAETAIGDMSWLEFVFITVFGVAEGIMWICTLNPVRKKFVTLFTMCCQKESEQVSVQHSVTNTENNTETNLFNSGSK